MSRIHQGLQLALQEAMRQSDDNSSPPFAQASDIYADLEFDHQTGTAEKRFVEFHTVNGSGSEGSSTLVNREALSVDENPNFTELGHTPAGQTITIPPEFSLGARIQQQISTLVQRVFVFPNSGAPRVVTFSSVSDNGGSSEICFHTGRTLAAEFSASVCLVDVGGGTSFLRRLSVPNPSIEVPDTVKATQPMKRYLPRIGTEDVWVMPSQLSIADASGRFSPNRMRSQIMALRKAFDYVLIDAPPVISAPSAVLLGQMADGMILVIEANSTSRHAARAAKDSLQAGKVTLLGAILNNHTLPRTELLNR